METVKDFFQFVGGNPAALVAYFDDGFIFAKIASGKMNPAAWVRKLDGVRDEIVQRLKNAVRISPYSNVVGSKGNLNIRIRNQCLLQAGSATQKILDMT